MKKTKLKKIYDMVQDIKTESITNWQLWQKIKVPNTKIVTGLKDKKKK